MTIHKLMLRSGFANDVGIMVISCATVLVNLVWPVLYVGLKILNFCIFDVAPILSRQPFGNWFCLAYFGMMWALLSDAFYGGELWRVSFRVIRLTCYDRVGFMGLVSRTQSYIVRFIRRALYLGWEIAKPPLKKYTVTFVKEIVLENAEDLNQLLTTTAGSTIVAVLINSLSSQLIREITPILSEMTKTMEVVEVIRQSTLYTEFHLTKMDQRLADLHLQLEYMRINQPDQFKDIVLRILPFVTAKDLLELGAKVPSRIFRFLTNGGNIHSLENGPLF